MNIIFFTKFSTQECINRIKVNGIERTFLGSQVSAFWNSERKFFYTIDGNKIKLERVYYRNIRRPIFIGELIKNSKGTEIEGHFQTHWFAGIFEIIWFTFAALFGVIVETTVIRNIFFSGKISQETVLSIFFPILFIGWGIFVVKSMKTQANEWKEEMLQFFEKTLEATIKKV